MVIPAFFSHQFPWVLCLLQGWLNWWQLSIFIKLKCSFYFHHSSLFWAFFEKKLVSLYIHSLFGLHQHFCLEVPELGCVLDSVWLNCVLHDWTSHEPPWLSLMTEVAVSLMGVLCTCKLSTCWKSVRPGTGFTTHMLQSTFIACCCTTDLSYCAGQYEVALALNSSFSVYMGIQWSALLGIQ